MSLEEIEILKKNNQELQEIINNSWDGIGIIDKKTRLIYVNNAFMPILGFSKNELLNKEFTLFMQDRYKTQFSKLLEVDGKDKKYKAEIDIVCIRKDNVNVYLKTTISSMLNKPLFVINIKDITSQISTDEILDDYVLSMHFDLHLHITKISTAFLKLTEYKKSDIVGKPLKQIVHKDTDELIFENINKTLETLQEWSGLLKAVKNDGTSLWFNIKIKPMYNKYGDVIGYTSLVFDATKEINLNDESSLLQKQIEEAKNQIKQKDQLLIQQSKLSIMTETLQKLSHEWRQPLNIISLQAQKLEFEYSMGVTPDTDKTIEVLDRIKNEANELSKTIESFQSYLKPDTKKSLTTPKALIDKAIDIFKTNSKEELKIEKIYEDNFSFFILEKYLVVVLVNILTNAKEQIIRNKIANALIEIKQYHLDNSLIIEISDNGGGIKDEILHKIFEPYFSTKEKKHGVGLGLYTSKLITNIKLGGVITASNSEFGATIKLSIPIEEEINR
ncbi:PAS domain-containing sensor histidine kinase [Halarcobacter ebronensis]|uniref:histidine kinase n=1 Tax=Halarcobacter ebronensis TaxID=1462615 RepID=A0A4Q1ALR4_9BACT|nr:PAS domain-containing sensor histidine kinase [Halarcobacter ebronensis]QKF81981.1 PAS sensor-containing two-component system histidine kinase [Halarcobacter ebronensis]RXK04304.1 hypothetical protein CRV07_11075 [Halarcobacter ebronensis]